MKITIVSSSTRINRVSHRIALALENHLNKAVHKTTVIDLAALKLPPFSERYTYFREKPEGWTRTMDTLKESHGIIFLTPEYNGSFSSGLKNFIDVFAKEGFRGKPIGVATGSNGSMGGVRAAYQVQQVIVSLFAYPLPRMLTVSKMKEKIDEYGEIIDADFKNSFENYMEQYIAFCRKISGG
jgi:NAD(P)H-dependent FMN reductase